jgi:hypothetical protein
MNKNLQNKLPYIIGLLIVGLIVVWQVFTPGDNPINITQQQKSLSDKPISERDASNTANTELMPKVDDQELPPEPAKPSIKEISIEEPVEVVNVLPSLDDSDKMVKKSLLNITPVTVFKLVVDNDMIRRVVVYIENLAAGKLADKHQIFTKPQGDFKVIDSAVITVDPSSYKRYNKYVELFTEIPVQELIALKDEYKPLINEAYAEIGFDDHDFDQRLSLAIEHLLSTPEIPADTPLMSQSVSYTYALPEYEQLSDAQKQLLRLGPDNVKKVKSKLSSLLKLL